MHDWHGLLAVKAGEAGPCLRRQSVNHKYMTYAPDQGQVRILGCRRSFLRSVAGHLIRDLKESFLFRN